MLTFLNKIRRRLLKQSKFGSYLLYALGEIVLVVAGILIALNVNNWNEARRMERKLNEVRNNVKLELYVNKSNLEKDIQNLQETHTACMRWLNMASKDSLEVLRPDPPPKLMDLAVWQANTFALEELVNMGGFSSLHDDSLVQQINLYKQALHDLDEHVSFMSGQSYALMDVAVKMGDALGTSSIPPFLPRKANVTSDGQGVYYSREFINRLSLKTISVTFVLKEYNGTLRIIDNLIAQLD